MFEHPVFCLASQVMDLTIREYLHHPLPITPPPLILLSALPPHPPLPSLLFLQKCCSRHACFLSVPLSVRVSGECTSREIWAVPHRISRGPFFCTICLWWTWMSGLVCKASFFWFEAHSFDLNAFLYCLHWYLFPVIRSDHVSLVCRAEQVGSLVTVSQEIVKEHLLTELLNGNDGIGRTDVTAPACVLARLNQLKSLSVSRLRSSKLFVCLYLFAAVLSFCLFVNKNILSLFFVSFIYFFWKIFHRRLFQCSYFFIVCLWRLSVAQKRQSLELKLSQQIHSKSHVATNNKPESPPPSRAPPLPHSHFVKIEPC